MKVAASGAQIVAKIQMPLEKQLSLLLLWSQLLFSDFSPHFYFLTVLRDLFKSINGMFRKTPKHSLVFFLPMALADIIAKILSEVEEQASLLREQNPENCSRIT